MLLYTKLMMLSKLSNHDLIGDSILLQLDLLEQLVALSDFLHSVDDDDDAEEQSGRQEREEPRKHPRSLL